MSSLLTHENKATYSELPVHLLPRARGSSGLQLELEFDLLHVGLDLFPVVRSDLDLAPFHGIQIHTCPDTSPATVLVRLKA